MPVRVGPGKEDVVTVQQLRIGDMTATGDLLRMKPTGSHRRLLDEHYRSVKWQGKCSH